MKFAIVALATLLGFNAFAYQKPHYPDQMYPLFKCKLEQRRADDDLRLSVVTGGIAGLTQVLISQSFIWGVENSSFVVQEKPVDPRVLTTFVTFTGKNILLKINTLDADQDGKLPGVVKFKNKNGGIRKEKLTCDLMSRAL